MFTLLLLPSGNLTWPWNITTFNWKINCFSINDNFPWCFVCLPEGILIISFLFRVVPHLPASHDPTDQVAHVTSQLSQSRIARPDFPKRKRGDFQCSKMDVFLFNTLQQRVSCFFLNVHNVSVYIYIYDIHDVWFAYTHIYIYIPCTIYIIQHI